MALHKAGRPTKPEQKKRQQLHISLYAEDLERLDRLTDNRSEFLRQCIHKAWEEKAESEVLLSITLPKSLLRDLRKVLEEHEPRHPLPSHRMLVTRLKE